MAVRKISGALGTIGGVAIGIAAGSFPIAAALGVVGTLAGLRIGTGISSLTNASAMPLTSPLTTQNNATRPLSSSAIEVCLGTLRSNQEGEQEASLMRKEGNVLVWRWKDSRNGKSGEALFSTTSFWAAPTANGLTISREAQTVISRFTAYASNHPSAELDTGYLDLGTANFWEISRLFKIHYLHTDEELLKTVSVIPVSFTSRLDPRAALSPYLWGVTLITLSNRHLEIVIEGVREGGYFMAITDFRGQSSGTANTAGINYEDFTRRSWNYESRSGLWKVHSSKVNEMIRKILKERQNSLDTRLNPLGCYSWFGNGFHSCVTWAREQFKVLNIVLPSDPLRWVVTRSSYYTPYKAGSSAVPSVTDGNVL